MHGGKNLFWFNSPQAQDRRQANFLVVTSGSCGAIWFASALNLHEGIFASCGIDHPIESCFRYDLKKDAPALLHASTPHHYRFGAHPEMMQRILEQQNLTLDFPTRDYTRLAWFVFHELEELPGIERFTAVGNVHAFNATQFSEAYRQDPSVLGSRRVVVTNMIRHPLPRVESHIRGIITHQLGKYRDAIDTYVRDNAAECRRLETGYGVSLDDPRTRAVIFVYRIERAVAWVATELRTFDGMVALKMEDLQSDPEYFARAVSLLTGGRIAADACYLDEVFRPENLGVGRRSVPDGTRPLDARAQWDAWPDWERAEFRACCLRHGVSDAYAGYGYDFSFMS